MAFVKVENSFLFLFETSNNFNKFDFLNKKIVLQISNLIIYSELKLSLSFTLLLVQ